MPLQPSVYQPRMMAQLFVPELGLPIERQAQALNTDAYPLAIRPTKARIVSNSYRHADELEITCTYDEAGVDPRYLRSAEIYFWLSDGGDSFEPTATNFRFIGIIRDVARVLDTTSKIVTLSALDYTTLFIESKPFPQTQLPLFTDTLRTAYQKVCRSTGHVDYSGRTTANGEPGIVSSICDADSSPGALDGVPRIPLVTWPAQGQPGAPNLDQPLGQAVSARIASLSKMQAQTGTDAWAVWLNACECQGLITFIRGNQMVVTTATEYYTSSDPPLFVYGQNVSTLTERRDLGQVSAANVCVRSYDGLTGTSLEAFFPDKNSPLARKIRKKKVLPSAAKAPKSITIEEQYELIDLQLPCTNQAILNKIAETIWLDRVRQELTGTLTTAEMAIGTVDQGQFAGFGGVSNNAKNFDLTKLQAGDNIQVQIEEDALDQVLSLPSDQQMTALLARGYSQDLANFIVKNMSALTSLPPLFLVHSCEIEIETAGPNSSGSYQMKVEYVNTLDISGAATNQISDSPEITGENHPPVDLEIDAVPAFEIDDNPPIAFEIP